MLFDGCLLACDVDGTLVYNGIIPPRNIEKIAYFMREGGMFSLSTGRGAAASLTVIEQLTGVSPSIVGNGSVIYDYEHRDAIMATSISHESHAFAKEILDHYPDVGIEIHLPFDVFLLRGTEETLLHEQYEKFTAKPIDWQTADQLLWTKVLFSADDEETLNRLTELSKNFETEDAVFVPTKAPFWGKDHLYFEQIPRGVSKGAAARELCKRFGIEKSCYFAIGDYYNDVEMLKDSGICAAPSTAPNDLQKMVDVVVGSAQDGAVADFIEYLAERRKGCKK